MSANWGQSLSQEVSMNFKIILLSVFSAQFVFAGFEEELSERKAYDHIIFSIFSPFQYKKKIEEVPEPLIAIHKDSEGKKNEMHMLHHGTAALYKRLEMLDRATKTIEMEYFIYSPYKAKPTATEASYEVSTKIVNNKLIEKAIQGVKVRLLLDASITVRKYTDFHFTAAREVIKSRGGKPENFEVRYYNLNSITGRYSNFRSHRKLLVIDDSEAITGGRNIEDKYYDLDHRYNFLDRDIWVKGSVVIPMRASFDAYWNAGVTGISKIVEASSSGSESQTKFENDLKLAREFSQINLHDQQVEKRVRELGEKLFHTSKTHSCPKTVFATDRPLDTVFSRWCLYGIVCGDSYKEAFRFTERAIGSYLRKLTLADELIVDSPYFLLNTRSGDMLRQLTKQNLKLTLHTNTLGSTDATYVSAGWYREVKGLVKTGVKAYVHGSKIEPGYPVVDENVLKSRWGTHSKTIIFGDNTFYVGTYNIDNRSSFYNAEMGLFCEGSKELTADVTQNFKTRLKNTAYRVLEEGKTIDANGKTVDEYGGASDKQKMMMNLLVIPGELLQFLM